MNVMTVPEATPTPARPALRRPNLRHAVCARCLRINVADMRAFCGMPVSDLDRRAMRGGKAPAAGPADRCIVCVDLVSQGTPCERCGSTPPRALHS